MRNPEVSLDANEGIGIDSDGESGRKGRFAGNFLG